MLMVVKQNAGDGAFDRLPVLKYDARAGRWHLMDRVESNGEWTTTTRDITMQDPTFAVDFGSIETGWLLFPKGAAPMMATAPYGQPMPNEPPPVGTIKDDKTGKERPNRFRQGFKVKVAGKMLATPDGAFVRELAANANVAIEGMNELHDMFEAAPEAAEGKIPVVRIAETVPVRSGQSTNYKPVFEVVQWVPRNADILGSRTVPPPPVKSREAKIVDKIMDDLERRTRGGGDIGDEIPFGAEVR